MIVSRTLRGASVIARHGQRATSNAVAEHFQQQQHEEGMFSMVSHMKLLSGGVGARGYHKNVRYGALTQHVSWPCVLTTHSRFDGQRLCFRHTSHVDR